LASYIVLHSSDHALAVKANCSSRASSNRVSEPGTWIASRLPGRAATPLLSRRGRQCPNIRPRNRPLRVVSYRPARPAPAAAASEAAGTPALPLPGPGTTAGCGDERTRTPPRDHEV